MKKLTKDEEKQLLYNVIVLDNKEMIVQQYWRLVYDTVRRAFNRLNVEICEQDIEDMTQEIFIRLFDDDCRRLKIFNPMYGCLSSWIVRISSNAVIDCLRKKKDPISLSGKNKTDYPDGDETNDSFETDSTSSLHVEDAIVLKEFKTYIKKQCPPHYLVVFDSMISGRSADETALLIKKSGNAVYIIRSRLITLLKNFVDES